MGNLLNSSRFTPVSGFTVSAAIFDGTNDYLTASDASIGAADSKVITINLWLHAKGDGTERTILANTSERVRLWLDTSNQLNFRVQNSSGTTRFESQSLSNGYIDAAGWQHVRVWVNLATGDSGMHWNGLDDETIVTAVTDDTIDHAAGQWRIGADVTSNANKLNGILSEVHVDLSHTPLDYSIDSNHEKFVTDADLRPVNLGSAGDTPLGAITAGFHWKGDTTAAAKNEVTGLNDFTVTGTLVNSAATPNTFLWGDQVVGADFPGSNNAAYTGTLGSQFHTADGSDIAIISLYDNDSTFPYMMQMQRSNIELRANDFRLELQNAIAQKYVEVDWDIPQGVHCVVVACQSDVQDDAQLWDNGVDQGAPDVIGTYNVAGNVLQDWTNSNLKWGQLVSALNEFDGGFGPQLIYAATPADIDISKIWDSTNSIPKWPGRKGENWTHDGSEPYVFSALPGKGIKRVTGSNQSSTTDLTDAGTGHPFTARALNF